MEQKLIKALSPAGFHKLAYTEWGDPDIGKDVICAHGLLRTGRDFDALAEGLSGGMRVACPDLAGRGRSDRLMNPEFYTVPQYVSDMAVLVARLGGDQVDWVGSSLGGIIGISMAALPRNPIRKLVVVDVGPFVPAAALGRIGDYAGERDYADLSEAEADIRTIYAPMGDLTDAQWQHLTRHSVVEKPGGGFTRHYDPEIAQVFAETMTEDMRFWELWDAIRCPVLVLRGADSDLLTAETAREMTRRGPQATLVEIPGCGHVPSLMTEDQIAVVREFLTA